jgi:hypothetical protein
VVGGFDAVVVFAEALEVVDGGPAAEWIGVVERDHVVDLAACRGSVAAGEAAVAVIRTGPVSMPSVNRRSMRGIAPLRVGVSRMGERRPIRSRLPMLSSNVTA